MNGSVLPNRDRVTINQVAEAAGVSKAGVSRCIGGDRQLLVDTTTQRTERAIDQLGYRPNQMARGFKHERTQLIGTPVTDILNSYSVVAIYGVETACRGHDYSLVMCNTDHDGEQKRHHLAALQSYNVEGLIVNTLGHHPGELRALYRELPMVLVNHRLAKLDTDLVGLDSADAVKQALDRPQQRGFRDILLVTEPLDGTGSRIERVQAFSASIGRRPALGDQVLRTDDFFRDGLHAFLSASGPGLRVLFTYSGVATLYATRQLCNLDCWLFDEVGLLTLDELDWYPLVSSGITAFAQPTDEIGRTAFERPLARLEGDREPTHRVASPA